MLHLLSAYMPPEPTSAAARAPYATCIGLAALAIAVSVVTQPSIAVQGGLGWDGAQYAALAAQCWREPMHALEPFAYRIGAPCLAALLPAPPKTALLIVNMIASVTSLLLMTAWLRRFVPAAILPWLLAVLAFHWLGPIRYTWWYPTYVDPLALCATIAALLLRERLIAFAAISGLGCLVRETVLVVPLGMAVGRWLATTEWRRPTASGAFQDRVFRNALVGVVTGMAAVAFAHAVATPASDYWMLDAAYFWASTKPPSAYALAWFVAYGPMLALPIVRWRAVRRFFADAPEHAVILIGFAVLAWIGGSDTERFLLWAAPLVLVPVGLAAAEIDWRRALAPLALLIAGQALNGRWLLLTPAENDLSHRAWPVLTPLGAGGFEQLLSQSADRLISIISLAQYLALVLLLTLWFRRRLS